MGRKLRILHCLRAPLGGLFRHVCDLVEAQAAEGHEVGIICDRDTGGPVAEARLAELSQRLRFGVKRIKMARNIGFSDVSAVRTTTGLARKFGVEILHGHGAKGGAYSRLAGRTLRAGGLRSFYTPHGGSLHYDRNSLKGRLYLELERRMAPFTDGLIFESRYSSLMFAEKVGAISTPFEIIPNGLREDEFARHAPRKDAADIVFVGELRHLKGVDILLEALAKISRTRLVTAHIYGDGPDMELFEELARNLGLSDFVDFPGRVDARKAFGTGRLLVVPSRAESFPYIVLEAGAAAIPQIVTDVGGIPEIIGPHDGIMIKPENVRSLSSKIESFLADPAPFHRRADELRDRIRAEFTIDEMARKVTDFYLERRYP